MHRSHMMDNAAEKSYEKNLERIWYFHFKKSFQHSSNPRSESVLEVVGSEPGRGSVSAQSNAKLKIAQR